MISTLNQLFENVEHGVYDFTKDGECTGCGACCSNYIPLSENEISEIKKYVKRNHIKEQKKVFPTRKPILDLTCPFLNENGGNKKCTIYEVRPYICRIFVCNQPPSKIKENKKRLLKARKPCDMRKTFFN